MNQSHPILFGKYPTLIIEWDSMKEKVIKEKYQKFHSFLFNLKESENNFWYNSDIDEAWVYFTNRFNSLNQFIGLLGKIIGYVIENNFPWRMSNIEFVFEQEPNGLIIFDNKNQLVKSYYLDLGSNNLIKTKTYLGKKIKI
jgi:hypothetical protein